MTVPSRLRARRLWCLRSRSRPTGAVDRVIAIRSMCGPSALSSTRCSPECSYSMWRRRHHIKWPSSCSTEKSRRAPGRGPKTSRSASPALSSCARLCSRIRRSDPIGKKWCSTHSSRVRTARRSPWTLYSMRNPARASNSQTVRFTSTQKTQRCISDCTKPQWRDSCKKMAIRWIRASMIFLPTSKKEWMNSSQIYCHRSQRSRLKIDQLTPPLSIQS